jgi:hypothetical protein
MKFSLNCLLLGEISKRSFSVNINDKIIVENNTQVNFEDIKVSHIKFLVFCKISNKLNINVPENLELWKIDGTKVESNENNIKEFFTKDVIKENLGSDYMEPHKKLSRYFTKDDFVKGLINDEDIHIIVQLPAITGKCLEQKNQLYCLYHISHILFKYPI